MRLRVKDIRLSYGGDEVLRGCTFSFDESGIYILSGANGSGKSTLLRVCALLERPTSGEVEFYEDGSPLPRDIDLRRRLTLVLPRVGLFNDTAYGNVSYGLKLRGAPRKDMERKAQEALEFVGLSHKARQNALTLSSGEAQRLGIARALAIEPEVLFLDEPTASVDSKNVSVIEDIVLRLRGDRRIIVMTTHDERQAGRLGDRALTIDEGTLKY
jgi:tungstate transport system ATP-binding protein